MNLVYVHMKTTRKEQPAIRLQHMEEKFGGLTVPKKGRAHTQQGVPTNQLADMDGPNVCRRQPRPRYAWAEDKLIAKTRRHMEEQFKGIYNLKNFWIFWIGCCLLKRFLNSTGYPMNDESLSWYTHSGEELLGGGNN
jgi:hypothetical protein